MTHYYTLTADHLALPCFNLVEWAIWMGMNDTRVARDEYGDGAYRVSTVFLGLDHRFSANGDPLLFETAILSGEGCEVIDRYPSWAEAAAGHERIRSIAVLEYAESHRLTSEAIKRALARACEVSDNKG
jgi:hypothetical protein